jgi:hypothetical protein
MATTYNYDTAGTGAFVTWGALAGGIKELATTLGTVHTRRTTLFANVADANAYHLKDAADALDQAEQVVSQSMLPLMRAAAFHLIETTDAEDELPAETVAEAVKRLREFMIEDSETLSATNVALSSTTYDVTNTGAFVCVTGISNPDGDELQNIRPEDVVLECVEDAQGPGPIEAGREIFTLKGEKAVPNMHERHAGSGDEDRREPAEELGLRGLHGEHAGQLDSRRG